MQKQLVCGGGQYFLVDLLIYLKIRFQFAPRVVKDHLIMQRLNFGVLIFRQVLAGELAGQCLQRPHNREHLVDVLCCKPGNPSAPVRQRIPASLRTPASLRLREACAGDAVSSLRIRSGTLAPGSKSPSTMSSRMFATRLPCSVELSDDLSSSGCAKGVPYRS